MGLTSFVSNIAQNLKWNKHRCSTFTLMVFSMIDQGNVQHHALSKNITTGNIKSKLERIRRFFAKQQIDYDDFAKQMILGMFKKIPKMDLILDRTNWKFGKTDINFLVLTATINGMTFPLFWSLAAHRGCSNLEQRKLLLDQFKRVFGLDYIRSFTADREFIGSDWIDYLVSNDIPFLSALRTIVLQIGVRAKPH